MSRDDNPYSYDPDSREPENPFAAPESDLSPVQFNDEIGRRVTYGGTLQRFGAAFIDGIILRIAMFAIIISLKAIDNLDTGGLMLFENAISIVLMWLYYAIQESSEAQATLGKRIAGLRVIDEHSGNRLTFGQASGCHFGKILSVLLLGIGYFMQPFTAKKQALHDMMAKALVVKA